MALIPLLVGAIIIAYVIINADYENYDACIPSEEECKYCPFPCDQRKN